MSNANTPVSVSNLKALDARRRAEYATSVEVSGTTVNLKNAAGTTISTGTLAVSIEGGVTLKGTVASESALPTEGNKSGDFYLVGDAAPYHEFVWTGTAWEMLGVFSSDVDTSDLVSKGDYLSDDDFLAAIDATDATEEAGGTEENE